MMSPRLRESNSLFEQTKGSWQKLVKVMLVTVLTVKDNSPFGETKGIILLPQQSVTFTFSRFGEEPMGCSFDVSTVSDAFIVTYTIESTWVQGMPDNPCY